ncbi:MAG: hypothetical protein AAGC60_28800 [Acidobacteriota bacterium]
MRDRALRPPRAGLVVAWLVASLCAVLGEPSEAQAPDLAWRTLETEHFRLHFPADAEPWARQVAGHLEATRPRLEALIGHRVDTRAEVVIVDPLARPNGVAWPLIGRPRLMLYLTPPPTDSSLGHIDDWGRLLALHEDAHLVHLLRRSRAPLGRQIESLMPVGPIPRRAPRWVIEGYATLLEGRIGHWGRPWSDLRAAVLRTWAAAGTLPSYAELSGTRRRWLGLSAPYLVGSAYLEWLEARELQRDPEAEPWPALWARLTARTPRSFEAAFEGVFGDTPRRLYGRFVAETTHRALLVEEARGSAFRGTVLSETEPWLDLTWRASAPALAPDGERLAMVVRAPQQPSRLVVWSTAVDEEAVEAASTRRRERLAADPDDVPPRHHPPVPRRIVYELPARHGAEPYTPRWSRDGRSLIFMRLEPDTAGDLHADLFRWTPGGDAVGDDERQRRSGRVERLTRGADVREADPGPDGWAVAVRHRGGASQLVRVDLTAGAGTQRPIVPLGPPRVDRLVSDPRLSPDGRWIAYVARSVDGWSLRLRSTTGDEAIETIAPLPPTASVAAPAWSADGRRLFASVGVDGFFDIVAFEVLAREAGPDVGTVQVGSMRPVVRLHGGALAPAPTPDGDALFVLTLEEDGVDLRRAPLDPALFASPSLTLDPLAGRLAERDLAPVVVRRARHGRAAEPTPAPRATSIESLPDAKPYGTGPLEVLPLVGGAVNAGGNRIELGLRLGDPIGRFELLALGGFGDVEGGAVAARWQGLPITLGAHAFQVDETLSGSLASSKREEGGVELSLSDRHLGRRLSTAWALRAAASRVELGDVDVDRQLVEGSGALRARQRWGAWSLRQQLDLRAAWGRTDEPSATADSPSGARSWRRARGAVRLELTRRRPFRRGVRLAVELAAGRADDAPPLERFALGGPIGSLEPPALRGERVEARALPRAVQVGSRFTSQRIELGLADRRLPVHLFAARHRLHGDETATDSADWLVLWGLELTIRRGSQPILRLPAFDLTLGLAQIVEAQDPLDLEDDVEGWITLRWRP